MTKKLTIPNDSPVIPDAPAANNPDAPVENNTDATDASVNSRETTLSKESDVTELPPQDETWVAPFQIGPEEKIPSNWSLTNHTDVDGWIVAISDLTSRQFEGTRENFSKMLREG